MVLLEPVKNGKNENISTLDEIISKANSLRIKLKSFLEYRRTYSNYFSIVMHHLRQDYPVDAVLRNGDHIRLLDSDMGYVIAQLQGHQGVEFDITNDTVTFLSLPYAEDKKTKVTIHGGLTNGEVGFIFLNEIYNTLPVKGNTILDIGANIGDSSIYFALRGARKIIGVEPFPKSYELAKKNIEENNLSNTITMLLAACTGNPGYKSIDPMYDSGVGSHLVKEDPNQGTRVPLLTLENILDQNEAPAGGIILKMDCEGCEYDCLLSASYDTLQRFSHMQIEYHHGYKNLKEKLQKSGFRVSISRPIKSGKLYLGLMFAERC